MNEKRTLAWSGSLFDLTAPPPKQSEPVHQQLRRSSSCLSLNKSSDALASHPKPLIRTSSTTSLLLREPPREFIGARIVRGPDWRWGKQDGLSTHILLTARGMN